MRTLWEAIERQRPSARLLAQRLHDEPIPVAVSVLLYFLSCLVVLGYLSGPALRSLSFSLPGWIFALPHIAAVMLVVMLGILLVRLVRPVRRYGTALSLIEPFTPSPPTTTSIFETVALASGLTAQNVLRLRADGVNALVVDVGSACVVAVTDSFAQLPRDEQEAGFAMLLGRTRVLSSNGTAVMSDGEPIVVWPASDPYTQEAVYAAWVEMAAAGDREGLLLTRNPAPMLRLLNRLSWTENVVPGIDVAASFQCLAWPFPSLFGATLGEDGRARTASVADAARVGHLNEVLPAGEAGELDAPWSSRIA